MGATAPGPAGPSLRTRIALAVALTVGFYALALAVAGLLIGVPAFLYLRGDFFNVWLAGSMVLAGGTLLLSVVPRRVPRADDGVEIDAESQPRLVGEVERVARAVGDRAPERIALTLELNAAVLDRGGLVRRSRRTLLLGLPLLDALTVAELRSVLAHEFGHYVGGDTRLGPWTWRTQDAIARTVDTLEDTESPTLRLVRAPFLLYARLFLRVGGAVSRRQELAADALAVSVAGREVHAAALRKVHATAPSFDEYWVQDVVPVLRAGVRPDLLDGYRRFRASPGVEAAAREVLDELMERTTDPHDSHPALGERLAFVENLAAGDQRALGDPGDGRSAAAALLEGREELEAATLQALVPGQHVASWERVSWADVGERIYAPRYESAIVELAPALAGRSFADVPALVDAAGELGRQALSARVEPAPADPALLRAIGLDALGAAITVALRRVGWRVQAGPGEPVSCRLGGRVLEPFAEIDRLSRGQLTRAQWTARMREAGLADRPLVAPAG